MLLIEKNIDSFLLKIFEFVIDLKWLKVRITHVALKSLCIHSVKRTMFFKWNISELTQKFVKPGKTKVEQPLLSSSNDDHWYLLVPPCHFIHSWSSWNFWTYFVFQIMWYIVKPLRRNLWTWNFHHIMYFTKAMMFHSKCVCIYN